jgi:peptidyl-prolyl cis-trans isomerase C
MQATNLERLTLIAALCLALPAVSLAQDAKPQPAAAAASNGGQIAKVNGVVIPQSRLDLIMKDRTAQGQPDSAETRTAIKENLITMEAIAQEATRMGLDKSPEVATRLELARQQILAAAYLDNYRKSHPISDEAMKAEYEKIKSVQGSAKEYKLRHILVANEAEANKIIAELKKGGNFEKIAAAKSTDPGSKTKGGDLGWQTAGNFVKPFGDAVQGMKPGQVSDKPVQTQFGWHVIKVENERPYVFPPYDEVKGQIEQGMQGQVQQKAIGEVRAKAKID